MFKLVKILLAAAHLLAQRAEARQRALQEKFKKDQATKAKLLSAEAEAAHAKARVLDSRAATAKAGATIGSNRINEAERVAASLRNSLDFIVTKWN